MNDENDWLTNPPEAGDEAARLKRRSQRNRKIRFSLNPSPRRRPGSRRCILAIPSNLKNTPARHT